MVCSQVSKSLNDVPSFGYNFSHSIQINRENRSTPYISLNEGMFFGSGKTPHCHDTSIYRVKHWCSSSGVRCFFPYYSCFLSFSTYITQHLLYKKRRLYSYPMDSVQSYSILVSEDLEIFELNQCEMASALHTS